LRAEKGSRKWIQKLINDNANIINSFLKQSLRLPNDEELYWYSPKKKKTTMQSTMMMLSWKSSNCPIWL